MRCQRLQFSFSITLYAALPSRKFLPQRTRAFLDFLIAHTQQQIDSALKACGRC